MHNMFPDVEYIEQTILYHQEQSMTRTEEETKEIIAEIEKIKERLVNTLGKEKEKEKEGVVQCAQDPT